MKNPIHRKRKDARATRAKVLAAAAEVVATEGPSALTLARAADAAGVSKGAVLYHFATKNDLIVQADEIPAHGVNPEEEAPARSRLSGPGDRSGGLKRCGFRSRIDPGNRRDLRREGGDRHGGRNRRAHVLNDINSIA